MQLRSHAVSINTAFTAAAVVYSLLDSTNSPEGHIFIMSTTMPQEDREQMTPAFYSSLGSNYETAFGHDEGLLKFVKLVLTHLPPQSNVLDIGCGTGHPVASNLANAGHDVTGIDISDEMVRLSRQSVPSGNFEVADMRTYEPAKQLDTILAILSLFPLGREEIEMQIERWSLWVPVGGMLGVGTIAAEDVDVEGKGGRYDGDGMCARGIVVRFMGENVRITLFTRRGLEALLRRWGFEVLDGLTERFVPPKEMDSDEEVHWFLVARKVG